MLAEIFSYIPDQLTVGQTSKKIYDISCDVSFCKLWLRSHLKFAHFDGPEAFTEEEIFDSMMNSKRRMNFIRTGAYFDDSKTLNIDERFFKIFEHFGKDVEQIEFHRIKFHRNVAELLNFMPNLEEIVLSYLKDDGIESSAGLELKLLELRKITSQECSKKILEVFNALPPGVLEILKIGMINDISESVSDDFEIFRNQYNIKVLVANNFLNFMNLKQMKMRHFELQYHVENLKCIEGQDEMTYFKTYGIYEKGSLKLICDEIKALQHLNTGSINEIFLEEITELSKLKRLRKLELHLCSDKPNTNEYVASLKNESLVDLNFSISLELTTQTVAQIGKNCPRLERLKLNTHSQLNVINSIIGNYPNLQNLVLRIKEKDDDHEEMTIDPYIFQEGVEHENLKVLCIFGWCDEYNDLSKLLGCCKKLEVFKTVLPISPQLLQDILVAQPNLKKLHLQHHYICSCCYTPSNHQISIQFVTVLETFGTNLTSFHCELRSFEDKITPEFLKQKFLGQFSVVKIYEGEKAIQWKMDN